jgi:hypothetical protein
MLFVKAQTVSDYQGTSTRKTYAPGLAFPLTDPAIEALQALKQDKASRPHNFVSLVRKRKRTGQRVKYSSPQHLSFIIKR